MCRIWWQVSSKLGSIYDINLRLFDVAGGKVLFSIDQEVNGSIENVLRSGISGAVNQLVARYSGDTSQSALARSSGERIPMPSVENPNSRPLGFRIAAYVTMGVGLGLFFEGFLTSASYSSVDNGSSSMTIWNPLSVIGMGFCIASIPLHAITIKKQRKYDEWERSNRKLTVPGDGSH